MTLHVTQLEAKSEHKSFRLTRGGGSPTAREVRDDVIVRCGAGQGDPGRCGGA